MKQYLTYEVRYETRDEDGDVTNSDLLDSFTDRNKAVEFAKEMRNKYGTVVIETWSQPNGSLEDTTLEGQYW